MPSDPNNTAGQPNIRSEFASDPDMQEIIGLFVQEMPERIAQLQSSWTSGEFDAVKRLAHQLKGAGGGYGFPTLGQAAGKLESSVNTLVNNSHGTELNGIKAQLDALVELCNRVAA